MPAGPYRPRAAIAMPGKATLAVEIESASPKRRVKPSVGRRTQGNGIQRGTHLLPAPR